MKQPALKDLVPIAEFRSKIAQWVKHLEETGRPVVLTQRGKAAAVMVTPDMLDQLVEERDVIREILGGLRDVAAGRVVDDDAVWAEVDDAIARREEHRAHSVD